MNKTRSTLMLVQRELWEHRALLVWTPFGIAALLLVLAVAGMGFGIGQFAAVVQGDLPSMFEASGGQGISPELLRAFMLVSLTASVPLFLSVTVVLVVFYCLDALYAERRDRSILFWRSLPVSDLRTVAAKAGVAIIVVPVLIVAALSMLQLGAVVAAMIAAVLTDGGPGAEAVMRASPLPRLWLVQLYGALAMTFWWAPLIAWLLLVSAWAPKAPIVWALLPPIAIGMIERLTLGTYHFFGLLLERLIGFARLAFEFDAARVLGLTGTENGDRSLRLELGTGPAFGEQGEAAAAAAQATPSLVGVITPGPLLASPGLWAGLLAAAILVGLAVYVRRYRGEH